MDFSTIYIDEREKGETRLKQCHLVMLRMLKIFDYLCNKYNIQYFLIGGSLLGAIRHQGFIPWDDDLDVGMTRENYNNFIKFAVLDLPKDIFFQNVDTDTNYPVCHCVDAKLRDKYSRMDGMFSQQHPTCHDGIMLDIFVFDKAFLPFKTAIILQNFFFRKIVQSDSLRSKALKLISRYSPFKLVYSHNFLCYFSSFKLRKNYLKAEELAEFKKIKFEDMECYIPIGFHNYLQRQYGNYMQLPAIEKRQGNHSSVLPDPFTACNHPETINWENK